MLILNNHILPLLFERELLKFIKVVALFFFKQKVTEIVDLL